MMTMWGAWSMRSCEGGGLVGWWVEKWCWGLFAIEKEREVKRPVYLGR